MSETVHYRGVLKKVEKLDGESLEKQCQRLMENKELPDYFDSYEEFILDENYEDIIINSGIVYRVEKESVDPYEDIFLSRALGEGKIGFDVRYYNGGCGFSEAIEQALKEESE